jgi:radical SAM protein with 4Fe4S-binding SPASM domain
MTSHYVKANQKSQTMPNAAFADLMVAVLNKDMPFRFSAPGFSMTPFIRFDPQLHLRFDRDEGRNAEIRAERLTPDEIVALERADEARFSALKNGCDKLINAEFTHIGCDHLFHCGAGNGSFNVSYDGKFRLCSSLWAPETMYDLRSGAIRDAWENLVPKVRDMRSRRREFLERCRVCPIINLCLWCPAHSWLETGQMDTPTDYFCQVAQARAAAIGNSPPNYS